MTMELSQADLIVDSIYKGGRNGNSSDDPLPNLLSVSNQGGFRYRGKLTQPTLIVLTTTMNEPDWPDEINLQSGVLTYFGDNRQTGRDLHNTGRNGNKILQLLFSMLHSGRRIEIPPIFVFQKVGHYRDVKFLGLAVPGTSQTNSLNDLVAIWRGSEGHRFQNYKAVFTILDTGMIKRPWLDSMIRGEPDHTLAPNSWRSWFDTGKRAALRAEPTVSHRSIREQLPSTPDDTNIIETLITYYADNPYGFEACAARLVEFLLPAVDEIDLTRPSRDGGRDAIGNYKIGTGRASVNTNFCLEAKLYNLKRGVGVKELSRLISRIRFRQFGILVTTSYLNTQAYKELIEDEHPIIVVSGQDIVDILKRAGLTTTRNILKWLKDI